MIVEDHITLGSMSELVTMIDNMVKPIEQPKINTATWQQVIEVLEEMEQGYFASSSGPDGVPWVANRPMTIAKKGHGIILRETWELQNSLTGQSQVSAIRKTDDLSLEFGTDRAWAWIHQDGGGRLPQRMFLGMNETGTQQVLDVVADAAVRMMFGGT